MTRVTLIKAQISLHNHHHMESLQLRQKLASKRYTDPFVHKGKATFSKQDATQRANTVQLCYMSFIYLCERAAQKSTFYLKPISLRPRHWVLLCPNRFISKMLRKGFGHNRALKSALTLRPCLNYSLITTHKAVIMKSLILMTTSMTSGSELSYLENVY